MSHFNSVSLDSGNNINRVRIFSSKQLDIYTVDLTGAYETGR